MSPTQHILPRTTPARAFVRNFNIMLKFARLYGFEHARTTEQIEKAWTELQAAFSGEGDGEGDILLASSGNQLLLNGAPLGNSGADRSLAQLLTSIGISSLHFSSNISRQDFDQFVRGFPSRGSANALSDTYKRSMQNASGVRLNEICFVPADSASVSLELAAQITGSVLRSTGPGGDTTSWFTDPERLLQLIAAAEGSRGGGAENSSSAEGDGSGTGTGASGSGTGAAGSGSGTGTGTGASKGGATNGPSLLSFTTSPGGPGGKGTAASGAGHPAGEANARPTAAGAGPYRALSGHGFGAPGPGDAVEPGGNANTGGATGGAGGVGGAPAAGSRRSRSAPSNFWNEVKASMRGLTVGSGPLMTPDQEDVCKVLRLLRQLPQNKDAPEAVLEPPAFQSRLSEVSLATRVLFHDALVALAAQVPAGSHDKLFLQRLAEHMAIRFAVDAFDRGDTEVNAIRQLLERMGLEISALREVLGTQESKLKDAGIVVEPYTDQLERQFWNAVPDASKRTVLLSPDAWSVPPRHLGDYVREQQKLDNHEACREVLSNYLRGLESENAEARRKTFSGLCDLSECYGDEPEILGDAITRVGARISAEEDRGLRSLASAAFVRLSQEGAARRNYPVLELVLSSLDRLESQAPALIQGLQQRIGLEDRLSDFIEDALADRHVPKGLVEVLQRLPRAGAKRLAKRFGQAGFREDSDLLLELFLHLGPEGTEYLKQSLADAAPLEVVEMVGLLSRINPELLIKELPHRLLECPRSFHDLVVRRIAFSGGPERGRLLASLYESFDPLIRPLALDEIGLSGDAGAIPWLLKIVESPMGANQLVRVKAIEALGRLRAQEAVPLLQEILEATQMFRWLHPSELRIVAAQTLGKIDRRAWEKMEPRMDLQPSQLCFPALDVESNASALRQRRYLRFGLSRPLNAVTTNLRENFTIELRSLNLGGGMGVLDGHSPEGTILALKFALGRRAVRAQVFVRKNLTSGVAFEIVEMNLADRSRLRQFLSEANGQPQGTSVKNRVRRLPAPSKR